MEDNVGGISAKRKVGSGEDTPLGFAIFSFGPCLKPLYSSMLCHHQELWIDASGFLSRDMTCKAEST